MSAAAKSFAARDTLGAVCPYCGSHDGATRERGPACCVQPFDRPETWRLLIAWGFDQQAARPSFTAWLRGGR